MAAQQKFAFGPLLTEAVERALMIADECLDTRDDYEDDYSWLYQEVIPVAVDAGDDRIERLLADTPGLLAYPVVLDELYPMEVVTPGWFIGEAAYRMVADAVAARFAERRRAQLAKQRR